MATLNDDEFLVQAAALIEGRPNDLVTPEATPAVAAPVETPPPVVATGSANEPAKVEPAVVEPIVVTAETPAVEPAKIEPADATAVAAPVEEAAPVTNAVDYKAVYDRLFGTPFKAAGQEITVNTPEEAISLMQKGAGFHSKMNRMQGDIRIAEMVKSNGIDETQLNLLIDAQRGKPGAIKKLLDSAKIDPLTLDSAEASSYAPSDHRVSDEQVRFKSVVSDLSETSHGKTVLQDARDWDQTSKSEIFKTPEVLNLLAQQKENGIYDRIVSEIERNKMLGFAPPGESFLQSYTRVGQQMNQAGAFGTPKTTPTPTPVAQKVITPAAPANAQKAAAAAPTRAAATVTKAVPETKDMGDDEFLKFMKRQFKI